MSVKTVSAVHKGHIIKQHIFIFYIFHIAKHTFCTIVYGSRGNIFWYIIGVLNNCYF